ncbi:MAG: hypothetical protein LBD60_00340, partial [Puniceicoccales bacterium]|nr:hypothetical protein [Puniceicoccales bacterium]
YIRRVIRRIFIRNEQFIILKKTHTNRLHNIFELPPFEDISDKMPNQEIGKKILYREIAKINRSIARERITEIILEPKHFPKDFKNLLKGTPELMLLPIPELQNITISGPHRKWLEGQLFARP